MRPLWRTVLLCSTLTLGLAVWPAAADEAANETKDPTAKADADQAPGDPSAEPVNDKCPTDGAKVDPKVTLVHEGKTIAFCCEGCVKAFKEDPKKFAENVEKYAKEKQDGAPATDDGADKPAEGEKPASGEGEKPAEGEPAKLANTKCPVSGDDVDAAVTTEHEGKTIGFCCEGCVDDFKKDPAKYAKNIK